MQSQRGGKKTSHNHCVAIVVSTLDPLAWEFALPSIRNSKLIHAHVEERARATQGAKPLAAVERATRKM